MTLEHFLLDSWIPDLSNSCTLIETDSMLIRTKVAFVIWGQLMIMHMFGGMIKKACVLTLWTPCVWKPGADFTIEHSDHESWHIYESSALDKNKKSKFKCVRTWDFSQTHNRQILYASAWARQTDLAWGCSRSICVHSLWLNETNSLKPFLMAASAD